MSNHIVNVGKVDVISLNDNLPVRSPFVAFPHTTIAVSYTHLTLTTICSV